MAGKKEAFLLVSLSEEKTKKLAQVVSNDTSRKILNYLSDHEATESEIAKELKLPISTVHYNLQQLMNGGLVIADEFHYSEKGKEVNHYKLANKYIIIAPKSTYGLKEKLRKIFPIGAVTIVAAFGIELANRLLSGNIFVKTSAAEAGSFVEPVAQRAIAESADMMIAAAPETVSNPIWQYAALWFLIGGVTAIVAYLVVDWIREK